LLSALQLVDAHMFIHASSVEEVLLEGFTPWQIKLVWHSVAPQLVTHKSLADEVLFLFVVTEIHTCESLHWVAPQKVPVVKQALLEKFNAFPVLLRFALSVKTTHTLSVWWQSGNWTIC
jgi:hypothetical protein